MESEENTWQWKCISEVTMAKFKPVVGPKIKLNSTNHPKVAKTSDILVIKIILVLVLVSFQSNHFYFI